MIELPEYYVLAKQINNTLLGKKIADVTVAASPHRFAWYSYKGNNEKYRELLVGKMITGAKPGVEIYCEDSVLIISTPIRYHIYGEKLPDVHQLLIRFEDDSHLSCTVQMWGSMFCFPKDKIEYPFEHHKGNNNPEPVDDAFTFEWFNTMIQKEKPLLSVKALLATEQRMPGLGNGVLHDILFNAQINPKSKISALSEEDKANLFNSIKLTLKEMTDKGGRDTERDLFGHNGGYKTILSSKTFVKPCPNCGAAIRREAYLGGNIYYCPTCQK